MTTSGILEKLRAWKGNRSYRACALEAGVSISYIFYVMRGDCPPSNKVLRCIGMEKEKVDVYRKTKGR